MITEATAAAQRAIEAINLANELTLAVVDSNSIFAQLKELVRAIAARIGEQEPELRNYIAWCVTEGVLDSHDPTEYCSFLLNVGVQSLTDEEKGRIVAIAKELQEILRARYVDAFTMIGPFFEKSNTSA